jgi:hypothetical protein
MKIAVCGDSFMAVDHRLPGKHFSELLTNQFDIINLALPGVSTFDICLQIEEAILQKVDYIIIGPTHGPRVEIIDPASSPFQLSSDISLKNFRPGKDKHFISRNIVSLLDRKTEFKLSNQVVDAMKMYISHIHIQEIDEIKNNWLIGYWTNQIEKNNIRYKVLPRDFCIYYEFFVNGNNIDFPSFHTDTATQELAAKILKEEILK